MKKRLCIFAALGAVAFVLAPPGRANTPPDPALSEAQLDAGFHALNDIEKRRPYLRTVVKCYDREGSCHLEDALAEVDQDEQAARTALDGFRVAEENATDPLKRTSAQFFEAVAWCTIGDLITYHNTAATNNPQLRVGLHPGAAFAFANCLEILHHIQGASSLRSSFAELLPYYEGRALFLAGRTNLGKESLGKYWNSRASTEAYRIEVCALLEPAPKPPADNHSTFFNSTPAVVHAVDCDEREFGQSERWQDTTAGEEECGEASVPPAQAGHPSVAVPFPLKLVVFATSGVGEDGNVTQLGRHVKLNTNPLSGGPMSNVDGKAAVAFDTTLGTEFDFYPMHGHSSNGDPLVDSGALKYSLDHEFYDLHHAQDTLLQTLTGTYAYAWNDFISLGLQVADTWQRSDERNNFNLFAVQPSFSYLFNTGVWGQLFFNESIVRSYRPGMQVNNPNGPDPRVGTLFQISLLGGGKEAATRTSLFPAPSWNDQLHLTLSPAYSYDWAESAGRFARHERNDFVLKSSATLFNAAKDNLLWFRSVTLSTSYEFRDDEYYHQQPVNSVGSERLRRDHGHLVDVALSVKMWYDERVSNRLEAIIDYKFNRQVSNVPSKDYAQPIFLASLKYNF